MFYLNNLKYTVLLSHPSGVGSVTLKPGEAVRGKFFSKYHYLSPLPTLPDKTAIIYDAEAVAANQIPAQVLVPVTVPHVVDAVSSAAGHDAPPEAPVVAEAVEEIAPVKKRVYKKKDAAEAAPTNTEGA